MGSLLRNFDKRFFQTSERMKRALDRGPSPISGPPDGGYKVFKSLTYFVAFPAILLCAMNCYMMKKNEPEERPPFVKYEYMRIRTKRFPWGEGQKSLFHNPKVNPLPEGYEDEG